VVAFPILALIISLACAVSVARDARRTPRAHLTMWAVSFAVFAIAAGAEVVGSLAGWSPLLAQVYYLSGAVLVVGFLALGEAALLWPRSVGRFVPGIALLLTALAATLVFDAPVDAARLQTEGWQAIERGPLLVALTVGINALGTLVLVGGALWSAWQFSRRRTNRDRMVGCILIAAGTLVVATGGTLTRLGNPELLYVAMALGVGMIFLGYRLTRSPHPAVAQPTARPNVVALPTQDAPLALTFVTQWLAEGQPEAIAERCLAWSATDDPSPRLTREDARRLWALRAALPDSARVALDDLPISTQRMLAELWHEVFLARADGGKAAG